MISVGENPIPWVFTKQQIALIDARFRRLVIPHNYHAFCTTERGLYASRSSCWRMASKIAVLFMLPVLFLDTIPFLQQSLQSLVHGCTLLIGRVISENTRRTKGLTTCSRQVSLSDVRLSEKLLPEGMSKFEKGTAPSGQKSHMHQIVHYPKTVKKLGTIAGCCLDVLRRTPQQISQEYGKAEKTL